MALREHARCLEAMKLRSRYRRPETVNRLSSKPQQFGVTSIVSRGHRDAYGPSPLRRSREGAPGRSLSQVAGAWSYKVRAAWWPEYGSAHLQGARYVRCDCGTTALAGADEAREG